jgi:hypothetical protein
VSSTKNKPQSIHQIIFCSELKKMEGYLVKSSESRYKFILEDYFLAYYDTCLVGVIPITEHSIVRSIGERDFLIDDHITLTADSGILRDQWVNSIENVIQRPKRIRAFFKEFKRVNKELEDLRLIDVEDCEIEKLKGDIAAVEERIKEIKNREMDEESIGECCTYLKEKLEVWKQVDQQTDASSDLAKLDDLDTIMKKNEDLTKQVIELESQLGLLNV